MRHADYRLIRVVLVGLFVLTQISQPAWAAASRVHDPIVRAIAVEGLRTLSPEVVLKAVTKTVVGEPLDPRRVQEDLEAIIETGYFSNVEAGLAPEGDGVKVVFLPTENPVVQSVRIETEVLKPEVFREFFSQKEGEVLNFRQLEQDLDALEGRVMQAHGYVVQPVDVAMSQSGELIISLAGARLGEIIIKGNTKTRDNVIRREFTVKPGEYLNMYQLEEDLRRVLHLGFFDEVRRSFVPVPDTDMFNLEVEVVERLTGSAGFGAGYSTADGFLGYLEYAEENFLGRGERLTIRSEFAQRKTSYDLGFYEPYLLGTRTSFGVNLYNKSLDRVDYEGKEEWGYNEHRVGGDLSLGRPIGPYTRGFMTLKIEDSEIIPDENGVEPTKNKTRSLTLQTRTDTTDHPFYPLSGMRANLSIEAAGYFFGGDTQFTKYVGETSRYFKVGSADQTLAFRLVGGLATGDLPKQEEFRVGGADTLRGYRYGEFRGDRMVYANAEYRFKIAKMLQGAVFVDVGQAWKSTQGAPQSLKVGYGVGLRLDTPLGIMRFDYGIGERGGGLFFSIGPSF
ncbi:MAG: BamA/TamA family outer membrane protein [Firmicutes bacterium]|jgi:outer membrane protein insertion porin family|nr:BamA/TamA family outer membrane protein [Bacillota bacterium]